MNFICDKNALLGFVCVIALMSETLSLAQTNSAGLQPDEKLPPVVQALSEKIQGKTPEVVEIIVNSTLGKPSRDVGSGRHIPVWDFPEGTLIEGIKFDFKSGNVIWLINTHNKLYENITGSYEMASSINGDWLGDIVLDANGNYSFTVSDSL